MKKKVAIGALLVAAPLLAIGGGLPYTFQSGQVISAAEINSNFAYLNSQIGGSSAGSLVTKTALYVGYAEQLVVKNGSAVPMEIVEGFASTSKPAWIIKCGGQALRTTGSPPHFLGPGCSLFAYPDGSVAMDPSFGYQVTYRQ